MKNALCKPIFLWRQSQKKNCKTLRAVLYCSFRMGGYGGFAMQYTSQSVSDTEAFGERLAKRLRPGTVLAFTGALGMGKTAFTRGLARGLGCRGRVTSPTFTIVNEYEGDVPLFHFDMYRLRSSDELYDIGWDDYLARGGVCAVEWSERVADALPEGTVTVDIARGETDESRVITVAGLEGTL